MPAGWRLRPVAEVRREPLTSIFLSYAHEDKTRAESLAKALEAEGWSIFWDRTIPTGSTWRDYIGSALHEAKCVVVAWSKASVKSDWVHEEADEGRERKILVPVLLEHVKPPLGFRSIQTETLTDWNGSPSAGEFRKLVADIEQLLGPPPTRQSVSTSRKAATVQQQESPAASQPPLQEVRPAKPTATQSSQPDRGNEVESKDADQRLLSAGLPKIAVGGVIGLVLIAGLVVSINMRDDPPKASTKADVLSENPATYSDGNLVIYSDNHRGPASKLQTPSEIEYFLQEAQSKLEEGHIRRVMGAGGAIYYYKKVLELEPENQTAILGLENIIDDTLEKLERVGATKDSGDIERYSGVITEACEQTVAALMAKCSDALTNVSNRMHPGSMNAIRNIRG